MQVFLRLGKNQNVNIQKTRNSIFTPNISKSFTFFPIPSFLNEHKCACGKKATVILDDMSCICSECVKDRFKNTNKFEMVEDLSFSLTEITIKKLRFEWSVNQERWYNVYGQNLKPKNWTKFLSKIKDMLLNGKSIILEVEYKKETKEMIIY